MNTRETSPEEQELAVQLYNLLEPPVAGLRFQEGGNKVLIYAVVPMNELPGGIIGCCAYWLLQVLGGPGNLAHLVLLLSKAVQKWCTVRSENLPLVG